MTATTASETAVKAEPVKLPAALPEDVKEVVSNWRRILGEFEGLESTVMTKVVVSLSAQNNLLIAYPGDDAPMKWLDKQETQEYVKQKISEYMKKEIEVEFQKTGSSLEMKNTIPDILKMPGINTTIIEED